MKILKRITAIILATSIVTLSGCNNEVKNKENLESVMQSNQTTQSNQNEQNNDETSSEEPSFDTPMRYGYAINSDKCDKEYNGEEITATYTLSNSGSAATYGVTLYVNGVQTEFKLNDSTETETNHIFNFELGEEKELNFKFTPYNCKEGETAKVYMVLMLKPDYTLPDATYLGFGNNHAISSATPFEIKINKDAPEKNIGGIYNDVTATDITKEIEEEYSNKDYLTGEITYNHLDHMTVYELFDKNPLDPFFSCDNSLELTARILGLPSECLAAIYIDNKMVSAFEGKYYAHFKTDRKHISEAKIKIDTSQLSEGTHHVYMIVIPVGETTNLTDSCRKTTSKLLVKGEKYISQAQDTYDKAHENENNNNSQQSESKDENSSTDAGKNDFSALNRAVIQEMTKIDENTLLARSDGPIMLIDTKSYKVIKEIQRTEGMYIQKIDNGFVTIDTRYESCSYDIYDCKGEKTKHVNIPMKKLEGEDLEFSPYEEIPSIELTTLCISADGKKAVYYGDNGLCTNSVELDDETVIQGIEELSEGFDKFYQMTRCLKYVDDTIYGEAAKYNSETGENEFFFASLDTKTKEWTIYYKLNDDQQIFNQDDFTANSFLIVDAGANSQATEGKLHYFVIGDTEMKEFICEEGYESTNAFISGNAKYILTTYGHSMNEAEIKLYDTSTGEVLISEKMDHNVQTAYIDEESRKLYIAGSGNFIVKDF